MTNLTERIMRTPGISQEQADELARWLTEHDQPGATHMMAIAALDEAMDEEDPFDSAQGRLWALEAANHALGTASVADEAEEAF